MVRRWAVRPDQELQLQDGRVLAIVSRDARVAAFVDAEAVQEQCGGFISIQSVRAPTEVPGEMVTTLLICEWRDRTDARDQPERVEATAPVEPPAPAEHFGPETVAVNTRTGETFTVSEPQDDVGDGLDPDSLEEEDLSSIPEPAR